LYIYLFIYLCKICFSKTVINSDDTALSDWITAEGMETGSCDLIQGTIQPVVEANRCDILKGTTQPFFPEGQEYQQKTQSY
jgi:hypothetical protein